MSLTWRAFALAAATGGADLILPPSTWTPAARRTFVVAPGLATAGLVAVVLLTHDQDGPAEYDPDVAGDDPDHEELDVAKDEPGHPLRRPEWASTPPRVSGTGGPVLRSSAGKSAALLALSAGLGVAVSGTYASSLWADETTERWLTERGVAHPRWWMAAFVACTTVVSDAWDRPGDDLASLDERRHGHRHGDSLHRPRGVRVESGPRGQVAQLVRATD